MVSDVYQSYVYLGQIEWCFQYHRFYKYVWSWWVCIKQIKMRYIWIKFLHVYLVGNLLKWFGLWHGFINHDSSSGPLYLFSLSKCIISSPLRSFPLLPFPFPAFSAQSSAIPSSSVWSSSWGSFKFLAILKSTQHATITSHALSGHIWIPCPIRQQNLFFTWPFTCSMTTHVLQWALIVWMKRGKWFWRLNY